MDDRRFDALTKALAKGASRRSVFKGVLGLGGAALTGAVVLDGDTDAARRPSPTPTPVKCPGQQVVCGNTCCCPPGLSKCGPDCCNSNVPVGPGYSECCDQACCFYPNDCVGEELCCPRLPDVGCLTPQGACCTTLCEVTPSGVECCPANEFCPGGSTSADLCCEGDTPIKCACGANSNACIADTDAACCVAADCDTPPAGSSPCVTATCDGHVCHYHDCAEGSICCPDNAGVPACRAGGDECCLNAQDCADTCEACVNFICVDDPDTFPCGPANDPDKYCCPETNYSLCCGATQFECCGLDTAAGMTRECDADGKCCEVGSPYFCTGSTTCCSAACVDFREGDYCCPPDQGRVCPGATEFVCCPNDLECSSDGECCPTGSVSCGDECCPVENICCQTAAGADGECCPSITQCNTDGECCPATFEVCGDNCCDPRSETPQCCNGACVAASVECCNAQNPCDGECETCVAGACVDDQAKCFGACGVCVNGICQGDESMCLACETCQFDPDTNTGVCVNDCTGCAECQSTDQASTGVCVPLDSECLSCQLCRLNELGTGGTCINNCNAGDEDGCGNCVAHPSTGLGVCVADNSLCPQVPLPAEVCCPSGDGFTCEAGPFCGCDVDGDCAYLTKDSECKVGVCNAGTCGTVAAPDTTICHQAGTSIICDPAVYCMGDQQSCPGADYAPDTTDCGACEKCNGAGLCLATCTDQEDCCPGTDTCVPDGETCCTTDTQCTVDCETCDEALGYCVSICTSPALDCCPNTPDFCVDKDAGGCCADTDCTAVDTCTPADCLDTHLCNAVSSCTGTCCDGFCAEQVGECCDDSDCTAVDTCTPADCLDNHACNATSVCPTGATCCGTDASDCVNLQTDNNNCGACNNACDGNACLNCQGGTCATYCDPGTHCDGAGGCVPDCAPIDGICVEDTDCCSDECCNGACKVADNQVCVVNADCCVAGGSCCRVVGGGLECKPGLGQCHCETDADCLVLPDKHTCSSDGTCV